MRACYGSCVASLCAIRSSLTYRNSTSPLPALLSCPICACCSCDAMLPVCACSEEKRGELPAYSSDSPDEESLVLAARDLRVALLKRSAAVIRTCLVVPSASLLCSEKGSVTIAVNRQVEQYQHLQVLESRLCSSVVTLRTLPLPRPSSLMPRASACPLWFETQSTVRAPAALSRLTRSHVLDPLCRQAVPVLQGC